MDKFICINRQFSTQSPLQSRPERVVMEEAEPKPRTDLLIKQNERWTAGAEGMTKAFWSKLPFTETAQEEAQRLVVESRRAMDKTAPDSKDQAIAKIEAYLAGHEQELKSNPELLNKILVARDAVSKAEKNVDVNAVMQSLEGSLFPPVAPTSAPENPLESFRTRALNALAGLKPEQDDLKNKCLADIVNAKDEAGILLAMEPLRPYMIIPEATTPAPKPAASATPGAPAKATVAPAQGEAAAAAPETATDQYAAGWEKKVKVKDADKVAPGDYLVRTTSSRLNVRDEKSGAVLPDKLTKDTKVKVVEGAQYTVAGETFVKINYEKDGKQEGYVSKTYLKPVEEETPATAKETEEKKPAEVVAEVKLPNAKNLPPPTEVKPYDARNFPVCKDIDHVAPGNLVVIDSDDITIGGADKLPKGTIVRVESIANDVILATTSDNRNVIVPVGKLDEAKDDAGEKFAKAMLEFQQVTLLRGKAVDRHDAEQRVAAQGDDKHLESARFLALLKGGEKLYVRGTTSNTDIPVTIAKDQLVAVGGTLNDKPDYLWVKLSNGLEGGIEKKSLAPETLLAKNDSEPLADFKGRVLAANFAEFKKTQVATATKLAEVKPAVVATAAPAEEKPKT